jgi:hypothetical protein
MAVLQGVGVTGSIVPKDSLDTYPTHESVYGKGSHRSVVSVTERDAITEDRREWGMLVTVWNDASPENNAIYELKYGESSTTLTDDGNWVVLSVGGGGGLTTSVSFQYEIPAEADTINVTSTTENHCLLLEPATALSTVSVVSPVGPVDGQVFEIRVYGFIQFLILDGTIVSTLPISVSKSSVIPYTGIYLKYRYSTTELQWFLIDKNPDARNLITSGTTFLSSQAGFYSGTQNFDKLVFRSLATRAGTPLTLFSTPNNVIIEFGSGIPSQEIYSVEDLVELAALPTIDLEISDLCLVLDTGEYYFWDGASWLLFPETTFAPGYLKRMGKIDCDTYPDYPAAGIGEYYATGIEGKIGGSDGKIVGKGDIIVCISLSAGGDESAEGGNWEIVGNAKYNTMNLATGLISGGLLTAYFGDTTFSVGKGNGIIVNNIASLQGMETSITEVAWNNNIGVTLDYLGTHPSTYLYIDSSGTLMQQNTAFTQNDIRTKIIIGAIHHPGLAKIEWYTSNANAAYGNNNRVFDLAKTFGPLKKSGLNLVPVAASLEVSILEGEVFSIGSNYQNDGFNPDLITIPPFTSCKIVRISNFFDNAVGIFYTGIDPDTYMDSGSPSGVTPSWWTIQRLFIFPESPDTLYIYYGWFEYPTKGAAIDGIYSEVFNEYEGTKNAVFLGYIVVQEASTDISNPAEAVFIQAGLYRGSNVFTYGGFANPMIATGDIIIGDSNGTPIRLAAGTDGYVLTLSTGSPVWAAGSGGGVYIKDADDNVFYSAAEQSSTALTGDCVENIFHQGAVNNVLVLDNIGNTFNQLAAGNTLGDSSHYNVFGIKASDNYLDQGCLYNTFKQGASNNTLDVNSQYNTFEQGAYNNFLDDSCTYNTFKEHSSGFIFGTGLQNVTVESNLVGANYSNLTDYDFLYNKDYASTIFTDGTDNYHRYYDVATDQIVITLMASPFTVSYIGGVRSVTGPNVDNTNPLNPIINNELTSDQQDAIDNANAPDASNPFVTIKDIPTSSALIFMLTSDVSDIGGVYKEAINLNAYSPNALATNTVSVSTTPVLLGTWATTLGYPDTTAIPVGIMNAHFETQKASGGQAYYCYFTLSKRDTGGTETLLLTSDNSTQSNVNTVIQQNLVAANTSIITLLTSDRLVFRVYGVMLSGTHNISLYYDDNTDARFELPLLFIPGGGGFSNPMTTIGDIIIGDTGGSPIRLAAGTNGHVLTLSGGSPVWAAGGGGGGMTNPMTTIGDIIIGDSGGSPIRLGAGSNGQVLSLSSGSPVWSTSKGSFGVTFDGQGGVVSVGKTDWVSIPYNCTITGWEIYGDTIGSCEIDIWKSTYATFPPTAPGIAGSEKPTLALARTNRDVSLSPAWATVTAGDCIMFYVESCSILTKINLIVYTNIII